MFLKKILNISELTLIYFKYFYGMDCFLSSLKCLALALYWKKMCQLVTEMWFWSGDILTDLVVFNFCTFHLKEKWTTMLQRWRNGDGPQRMIVNDCMNAVWKKNKWKGVASGHQTFIILVLATAYRWLQNTHELTLYKQT